MNTIAPIKTRLQVLLYERGLSEASAAKLVGMQQRSMSNKVHRRTQFTLSEMKAIQKNLFPEMSLEEIFEGYGQ